MYKPELAYLFYARMEDGSEVQQTAEDISRDGSGSAYSDVVNAPSKPEYFALLGNGHEYGVDLTTGVFHVDGIAFRFHNESDLPITNVELVYWRQNTALLNFEYFNLTGELAKPPEVAAFRTIYRFGFMGVSKEGVPFQRVMEIE